ncbi:MAG: esterase/lipase family protein, partial [Leucothrix sp.]
MADNEHGIFPIGGTENPNRSLDVIFVHGLGGDARTTWEDGDAFWPKWLSEDFPNIGIWTIGYGADRSRWVNDVMSMEDRGLNLLNHLSIKNIGEKPILFIAHSMGGLISKHLLEQGRNNSTEDYRRIVENTVGVIFIATPHSGSGWADALDALPLYRGNRVIDGLKKDEPALRRLSNAFTELVKAKSLKCLCFFETKEIRVKNKWFGWKGIQIVSENSASGNFPKEKSPVGLDDDHLSICRLKSRESQLYGNVAKFIRESLTENTLTKPAVSLDKSTTKPVETSD